MNRKFLMSCGLIVFMATVGVVVAQEPEAPAEEGTSPLVDEEVDVSGIEQIHPFEVYADRLYPGQPI